MKYYFSRRPGQFVNRLTGEYITGYSFNGTIREWYEGLCRFVSETARDHFKIDSVFESYVGKDIRTIHECCKDYRLCGLSITKGGDYVCGLYDDRLVFLDETLPRNQIKVVDPQTYQSICIEIVDMDII